MLARIPGPFYYLAFCLLVFGLSPWVHATAFFYLPFILGVVLIFRSNLIYGLCIIMAYLSVEGAFKLFSQYDTVLRLAIDLLIICLLMRLIQIRLKDATGRKILEAPFVLLFFLHVGWILVEFLNPHALGLLASLAAYKVYISALFLYFISYTATETSDDLDLICWMALFLVLVEVATSAYQFSIGEAGLAQWSPYYHQAMGVRFKGAYFRPFGTSNVAGGGSTLIFLLTPVALSFLLKKSPRWAVAWGGLLLMAVSYILFISQVRAALLKALLGCAVTFLILFAKKIREVMFSFVFLVVLSVGVGLVVKFDDSRFQMAEKRLLALGQISKVWEQRSHGSFDSVVQIVSEAPLGIGLSRVGAAAEPFKELIQSDLQYGLSWSFADNLYKALLVEIGIPGLLIYMIFLIMTFYQGLKGLFSFAPLSRSMIFFQAGAIGTLLASFAGHMGSEGFLYQPESTIVWIFIGALAKLSQFKKNIKVPIVRT